MAIPSVGTAAQATIAELQGALGDRVSVAAATREQHGQDEGWHEGATPDAVLFAESTDDVIAAVTACARHRVPLIPFGVGTSLEGHVAAIHGGVTVDLSRMTRV